MATTTKAKATKKTAKRPAPTKIDFEEGGSFMVRLPEVRTQLDQLLEEEYPQVHLRPQIKHWIGHVLTKGMEKIREERGGKRKRR